MIMALVRRNQYWLPSIFNDIFDDDFMGNNLTRLNSTSPAVNIIENEKDFTVELAAPGLTKDDFKINISKAGSSRASYSRTISTRKAFPRKWSMACLR